MSWTAQQIHRSLNGLLDGMHHVAYMHGAESEQDFSDTK